MDPPPTRAPRKVKFIPKAPQRRPIKSEVKPEVVEDADDTAQAEAIMRRITENAMKAKAAKGEKKVAATQIAFGYGGEATRLRSFGKPGGRGSSTSNQTGLHEKEYKEPWDYYSYYPVTLPLRRPYSGNPELLNEEEFRETSDTTTFDESTGNPAVELGLMDENAEQKALFFQLPPTLPMLKRSATADGHQQTNTSKPRRGKEKTCGLDELPAGYMGKLLVYKSGSVKMKLGDTLYNVSPGIETVFAQDVVAVNTEDKKCCVVGELSKRAILTPDVDSILSGMADL